MILGKTVEDWGDIYSLIKFYGGEPKSMADLYAWQPPSTPKACLKLGLDLLEARKLFSCHEVSEWVKTLLTARY